jgi:hypothetical protein
MEDRNRVNRLRMKRLRLATISAIIDADAEKEAFLVDVENGPQSSLTHRKHGGSFRGKRPNKDREREEGHDRLVRDYFGCEGGVPVYSEEDFRRRFRMSSRLFTSILKDLQRHDKYFIRKEDCTGKLGLSGLQKTTAAMRMLAYGISADAVDEYCRIGESTAQESLERFCDAIIDVYGKEFLRSPTSQDVETLCLLNEKRGFPGMLGSLDCMHWEWKNCPKAWAGQYTGKEKAPTVVLEAVASYDCWIWHAFFGVPGSCNDINVLDRSTLLDTILLGQAPAWKYKIVGHGPQRTQVK